MVHNDTQPNSGQDNTLAIPTNAAEFEDEGSGATSGYGDTTEDDLGLTDDEDDDLDNPLEKDPDDDLKGDDANEDDL